MPETRSSATDQEMSQTTLNKGQRQMDSVLKSWGFRTSRDPFQENSSQGLEGNKGQKSTPLREVGCSGTSLEKEPPRVCSLVRDDISGQMTGRSQLQLAHALERNEPRADRLLCLPRTDCADSGIWTDRAGLVGPSLLHRSCRVFHISLGQSLERGLEPLRAKKPEVPRSVFRRTWSDLSTTAGLEDRPGGTTGSVSVDRGAVATRFFDVLTARVFQEKKP